jgi:uncharacterized ferredoxin-like protein
MILNERESRQEYFLNAIRQIMTVIRTAPKAKGFDIIETAAVTGDDIRVLAEKTKAIGEKRGLKFMLRDAENIMSAGAVLLVGTRAQTIGLNCGHCGFEACAEKPAPTPCAINTTDVGIALGSACAAAADLRLDTRLMFSVGLAAQELKWLGDCQTVFALPISISSKNPFFDRGK